MIRILIVAGACAFYLFHFVFCNPVVATVALVLAVILFAFWA